MSKTDKNRPSHVPAENEYHRFHWTLAVALISVVLVIYLFVSANG
jgi:hypothetical protein